MPIKKSALSQMADIVSNQVLAGANPISYDDIAKVSDMMSNQSRGARTETGVRIDAPMWGGTSSDTLSGVPTGITGTTGTPGRSISYPDTFEIQHIIKIRDKLDDFLDGSNVLIKVMNPQTIREMVREMRSEIKIIKKEENISELDIVNYLEEELADEENQKADARARIYKYDADNEVPF